MGIDPQVWPEAAEYFETYAGGRTDTFAHLTYIYPIEDLHQSDDPPMLHIGRAGADGIEFVFRRGVPGVWAYYPIERDLRPLADTLKAFVAGWLDGTIKV